MQHLLGQHVADAGDGTGCPAVDKTVEHLGVHTHHEGERGIAPGDVFGGIAERGGAAKFLEAHEVGIFAVQFKEQVGLGFVAVVGAVVDDGGQVHRRLEHAFKVGPLGCKGRAARKNARNDHEAACPHLLGMSGKGSCAGRILRTGADNYRHLGLYQTLHPFHAFFIRKQRPIPHGAAIDHGRHASRDQLSSLFHQRVKVWFPRRGAGGHEGGNGSGENVLRHDGSPRIGFAIFRQHCRLALRVYGVLQVQNGQRYGDEISGHSGYHMSLRPRVAFGIRAIMSDSEILDLLVIGGGVNGTGIARDAAGRGLSVLLCEKDDLASATSSASTKLIHGGLRYLEYYKFRLVREALAEREVLLRAAPHIIWPLRFILPQNDGMRPWPLIRLGLFLYDHLGGRKILPGTRAVDLSTDAAGAPLNPRFSRAYEYSDCWVDDARLVVLNARGAAQKGAVIRPRTECVAARRVNGMWEADLRSDEGGTTTVRARGLINAAGPWVAQVLGTVIGLKDPDRIRLVKGSHVVVDRLFDHDRCYIFQNADGRICFAIPYEQNFTLIGTTDLDHDGDPGKPQISADEIDYLLASASEYFRRPVTRAEMRWSYSGVRPLYDDGASKAQETTRDYVLKLDQPSGEAPLLSVFGGKITTFRRLAEAALKKLEPFFPAMGRPWTAEAPLPGGDFPEAEVASRIADLAQRYSFLTQRTAHRLFRAYGTEADRLLSGARFSQDMGKAFGVLSEREVDWLQREEWARSSEDILWRRSKLGLHLSAAEQQALRKHLGEGKGS